VKAEQIKVLIHPQSIVHSMVEFNDGSIKAQLGVSDMKIPIAYALSYPNRLENVSEQLRLDKIGKLEFYEADEERFIPIKLAYKALKEKGTYPCVLNAANEEAVNLFLNEKIQFHEIFEIVNNTLKAHNNIKKELTLKDIIDADLWARDYVRRNY
jgi:1-deoxy-D-xylulose-5-phosphate reductoisomerase